MCDGDDDYIRYLEMIFFCCRIHKKSRCVSCDTVKSVVEFLFLFVLLNAVCCDRFERTEKK